MKKFILVFGLVFLAAQYAGAQQSFGGGGHMGISISAFPKELKDYYGLGFGFGGHSDYNLMKYLTLRFNGDWHMFGFDNKKMEEAIAKANGVEVTTLKFEGRNANIFGFTFNGLGKIPTKTLVTPYGILGLGIHILSVSDAKIIYNGQDVTNQLNFEKNVGETKFGLNFGAGAEFAFGGFKAFIEFKYVIIFTKDESTGHMPITIGFGI